MKLGDVAVLWLYAHLTFVRAGCAEFLSGDVTFYGFGGGLDFRGRALTMEFVVSVFPVLAIFLLQW